MRIITVAAAATLVNITMVSQVFPQTLHSDRPGFLAAIAQCRMLTDDADRLACFDRTSDALEVAERQGDLVVMERQQIREARRQLFGFNAPALPSLFSRSDDGDADGEVASVETTLVSAGQDHEGKWTFRLADGSEWRQIDSAPVRFHNRSGNEVRVRRAALGSYLLTAGKSRAVRVKRQ